MDTITSNNNFYAINGKPGFLVSAEFHYFRVPQKDWGYRLDMVKEAGCNCVATYIPWMLHEPEEGIFRFSDSPETDLDGFLSLCRQKDLLVIARPGPYQYSEMRLCGLPSWLFKKYPEILALNKLGKPLTKFSVSYLHPVFLEKTKNWFNAVLPIIAKHLLSRGGAVAYTQVDNELTGIHDWFGGWDYHPVSMGYGREDGRYGDFMKKNPYAEYSDFYFETISEYVAVLTEWIREAGIDCDIIHNAANPHHISYFYETCEKMGKGFILGMDLYFCIGESVCPTPLRGIDGFVGHESLRLMGYPPTVYEMQAGQCTDWPPVTPEDLDCWYKLNTAFGMKGLNYYVFTGGPNPNGMGDDGNIYDYNAPIGPDNEIRPSYATLKEFGEFLLENDWLAEATIENDFYLGFDWRHSRGNRNSCGEVDFNEGEAWEFIKNGVIATAFSSFYSPEMVDLSDDIFLKKNDKPLIVCAARRMSQAIQRRLVDFIQCGGKLLLAPVIPEYDENGRPCRLLGDFLASGPCRLETNIRDIHFGSLENVKTNSLWLGGEPSEAKILARDMISGETAAWMRAYPSGGAVIWLGLKWRYQKFIHRCLFKDLMKLLGVDNPVVTSENPNIWAVVRRNKDKRMLFLINLFSSPVQTCVSVRKNDCVQEVEVQLQRMEVKTVVL